MSDDGHQEQDVGGEEEQKKVTFSEQKQEDKYEKEETAEEREEEGPKTNASKTESPGDDASSDKSGSKKTNEPDSPKRDKASDVHKNDDRPTDTGRNETANIKEADKGIHGVVKGESDITERRQSKTSIKQDANKSPTKQSELFPTSVNQTSDSTNGKSDTTERRPSKTSVKQDANTTKGEKDTTERRQSKTSIKQDTPTKQSELFPSNVNQTSATTNGKSDTTERRQSKTSIKQDTNKSPIKQSDTTERSQSKTSIKQSDTTERSQSKTSIKQDINKSPTKQSELFPTNVNQTSDTTNENTKSSSNTSIKESAKETKTERVEETKSEKVEKEKYAFKTDDEKTQQSPPARTSPASKVDKDNKDNVSDDVKSNKEDIVESQPTEPTRGSISNARDGTFYMGEEDYIPDDSFESENLPDDDKVSVRTASSTEYLKSSYKKDPPADTTQQKEEKPGKRVGISNITINYDTFKSRKPILLPEQVREKERRDRLQRVMSARESGRYGGLSSRASSRTSSRWSSRPPSRPRTCGYDSERRKKEKEFFHAELNRLKDSLRKESKKIKKPKVRDHYPDVFTSLEPYYNTYTANYLINMPDLGYTDEQDKEKEEEEKERVEEEEEDEAPKDLLLSSRKTAIGLCDPWDSLTMDREVLPKIETADMRKKRIEYMHSVPKPKSSAGKPKRPEAKKGSTRLPKFPVISLQNQELATKELIYNDVPMLRDEMSKSFSHSGESRKQTDYTRTRQDFYRMELDRMEDYHSLSRPHMRKAYFAYLQNTPGSRKAVYDCMKELGKKKKESQPQAVA